MDDFWKVNLKAKCTWCGQEMERTKSELEGPVVYNFSCKSDPLCELSQVEVWVED